MRMGNGLGGCAPQPANIHLNALAKLLGHTAMEALFSPLMNPHKGKEEPADMIPTPGVFIQHTSLMPEKDCAKVWEEMPEAPEVGKYSSVKTLKVLDLLSHNSDSINNGLL